MSLPQIPSSASSRRPHATLVLELRAPVAPRATLLALAAAVAARVLTALDGPAWLLGAGAFAAALVGAWGVASIGGPAAHERLEHAEQGGWYLVTAEHSSAAELCRALPVGSVAWWLAFSTPAGRRWIWIGAGALEPTTWRALCRAVLQRRRVDANC